MSSITELKESLESYRARARGVAARVRSQEDAIVASVASTAVAAGAGYLRGRWADNYGMGMILGVPAEAVAGVALTGAHLLGWVKTPVAKAAGDSLLAVYAFQLGLDKGLKADAEDKAKGR